MANSIIKGNNQIYIKLYGNVDVNDTSDVNVLKIFNENYSKLTLDITEVLCYNDLVVGFKELFTQYDLEFHNVIIKERDNAKQTT